MTDLIEKEMCSFYWDLSGIIVSSPVYFCWEFSGINCHIFFFLTIEIQSKEWHLTFLVSILDAKALDIKKEN